MMKKRSLTLLLLPLLLAPFAHASSILETSGPFASTVAVLSSQSIDGTTLLTQHISITIGTPPTTTAATSTSATTDGITGTCAGTAVQLIFANGKTEFFAVCGFTGTVPGGTGTGTAVGILHGTGMIGTTFPSPLQGHFTLNHGTGGLAGLRVEGSFKGMFNSATSSSGTYSAQVSSGGESED